MNLDKIGSYSDVGAERMLRVPLVGASHQRHILPALAPGPVGVVGPMSRSALGGELRRPVTVW